MTKIQMLVSAHYKFFRQSDISNYIAKLLEKHKFGCDNNMNLSNQSYYG